MKKNTIKNKKLQKSKKRKKKKNIFFLNKTNIYIII